MVTSYFTLDIGGDAQKISSATVGINIGALGFPILILLYLTLPSAGQKNQASGDFFKI
jgi:hypothetical protein